MKLKKTFLKTIEKGRKAHSINKETTIKYLECKLKKKNFEILIASSDLEKFKKYVI